MTDAIQESFGKFHPGALALARGTQFAVMLLTALLTYRGLCLVVPAGRGQTTSAQTSIALQTTSSDQIHAAQAAPVHGPIVQEIPMQTEVVPSRHARHLSHSAIRHHAIRKDAPQSRRRHKRGSFSAVLPQDSLHSQLGPDLRPDLGLVPQAIVNPAREKLEVSSLVLINPRGGQKAQAND